MLLLGQDVFDVGFKEGEGVEDLGADGALRARFHFGLCARGDAGFFVRLGGGGEEWRVDALFLEHCEGCVCGVWESEAVLAESGWC